LKRIVIDASTLLSGLGGHPHGPSATLLNAVYDHTVEAIACPTLIEQVQRGLAKPYFQTQLSEQKPSEAITAIETAAVMLADPIKPEAVLRDPTDDYLVALARTAKADFIVTGDKDLLDHIGLRPPAINARQACELLGLIELS
jgi:putative PIN family toxin of toxin-antitoxin system